MQKYTSFLLVLLFIFIPCFSLKASAAGEVGVSASSAILMNADTGEILFEKNAHEKRGIASTTKIMTALIAVEYGCPDKNVTVTADVPYAEGTAIGLKTGDSIKLSALIYGMLLESGNDAANTTACAIGGSIEGFVKLMNEKAKSLSMNETSFKNPSGLTADGHYSTAYDMALLASYAIKNPYFKKVCSTRSIKVSFGTPECIHYFSNHNKLLFSYEGMVGIKTGYTKACGRCLVTAAQRGGITLVAVTLNAGDDWNDHIKMLDYGFKSINSGEVSFDYGKIKIPVISSETKTVSINKPDIKYFGSFPENGKYTVSVYKEQFVYAPVFKGDILGEVVFKTESGTAFASAYLTASESAACNVTEIKEKDKSGSLLNRFKKFTERLFNKQT